MLLLVVILTIAALVAAQQWPTLPASYTATVAANFHDDNPQNCFTLAFTEAVDNTTGSYLAQGRFGGSDHTELYFFNSDVVFNFDQTRPSDSCSFYSIQSIPANARRTLQPSTSLFAMFGANPTLTYLNRSNEVRTLEADKWQVNFTIPNFRSYTATVFFAVGTVGLDAVPLRVELYSPSFNVNQSVVHHTYDWVNFVPGVPPATLFQVHSNCQQGAWTRSRGGRLGQRYVPVNSTDPNTPPLPAQFTATLEAKLNTWGAGSSVATIGSATAAATSQVYTVVWSVDTQARQSRFDYFTHSDSAQRASPTLVTTHLFQYEPNTPWGSQGKAWMNTYNISSRKYAADCQFAQGALNTDNRSPLLNVRAGSIPRAFSDPISMTPHRLANASLVRGIMADTYTNVQPHVEANIMAFPDGLPGKGPAVPTTFNFDMDLMFFPRGWGFPGRGINETEVTMPIRVRNTGTLTNSTSTYAYQDVWDLFRLLPHAPPVDRFDPTTIGCPANGWVAPGSPIPPPPAPIGPGGTPPRPPGTAGAWVGGIAIGAALAAVGVAVWRWRVNSRDSHQQMSVNGAVPLGNVGTRN